MIDVEAHVFDYVWSTVSPLVPQGCFKSVYVPNPPKFPFATLMEMDNITDVKHRGTAVDEEYAIVTYEANVYSMDKYECRRIMNVLDRAMVELGFTRASMQFIPNLADTAIFRLTARYQATADNNNTIYRKR